VVPVPYAQETMNGFEYAAAAHMIQEGMVRQGMEIVAALRDRYDGERRNPWNEFECGHNYARSMASYSLLNAFSGFRFDMARGMIGFDPVAMTAGRFRCFWSLDSGWGVFEVTPRGVTVRVLSGSLRLRNLALPFLRGREVARVSVGKRQLTFERHGSRLEFSSSASVTPQATLVVSLGSAKRR